MELVKAIQVLTTNHNAQNVRPMLMKLIALQRWKVVQFRRLLNHPVAFRGLPRNLRHKYESRFDNQGPVAHAKRGQRRLLVKQYGFG